MGPGGPSRATHRGGEKPAQRDGSRWCISLPGSLLPRTMSQRSGPRSRCYSGGRAGFQHKGLVVMNDRQLMPLSVRTIHYFGFYIYLIQKTEMAGDVLGIPSAVLRLAPLRFILSRVVEGAARTRRGAVIREIQVASALPLELQGIHGRTAGGTPGLGGFRDCDVTAGVPVVLDEMRGSRSTEYGRPVIVTAIAIPPAPRSDGRVKIVSAVHGLNRASIGLGDAGDPLPIVSAANPIPVSEPGIAADLGDAVAISFIHYVVVASVIGSRAGILGRARRRRRPFRGCRRTPHEGPR